MRNKKDLTAAHVEYFRKFNTTHSIILPFMSVFCSASQPELPRFESDHSRFLCDALCWGERRGDTETHLGCRVEAALVDRGAELNVESLQSAQLAGENEIEQAPELLQSARQHRDIGRQHAE